MQKLILDAVNRAIQTVLSVDPDSVGALAGLTGKVYCIELTMPPVTLYLLPDPEGFMLSTSCEQEPDVTLKGSVLAFARLSGKFDAGGRKNAAFGDGQITMQGDAEAGQALQQALAQFDLDWEELIARAIGDTPARKVGNAVRSFGDWATQTATLNRTNFADYLTEERQLLASKVAMQRLERGVSGLRSDSDRLAQRIARLQNHSASR